MNFNEWYDIRDHSVGISTYKGNTNNYFEELKHKIEKLKLNEGLKEI